jgi:hypothetical protein
MSRSSFRKVVSTIAFLALALLALSSDALGTVI